MLPDPLHPAVVHFPVVLMILLPLAALAALWMIRRGVAPARAWAVPVIAAAALSLSAWVALKTGGNEEERVEDVVPEQALETHEEAGERFLVLSGVLLVVMAAGLVPGRLGQASRAVATVGAFALIAAGVSVGHSGGQLVYRHGAGSAYAGMVGAANQGTEQGEGAERESGEDKD